jgi:Lysine 2,3-aminomutase
MLPDHPKLALDSLHEEADSPVKGLVHRYPDKALFLRKCWHLPVRLKGGY